MKIVERAKFSLRQRLERVDFEEDHLMPLVESMLAGKPVYGLEAGETFDLVIEHENPDSSAAASAAAGHQAQAASRPSRRKASKGARLRHRK